jgi:hypothetical protein
MAKFLLSYRVPKDYTPGRPETVAAWTAWFESMGANLADQGLPVIESSSLGNCGADTRLGGYSLVTADDLEAALTVAKGCPALEMGAGIEVGVIMELNRGTRPVGED